MCNTISKFHLLKKWLMDVFNNKQKKTLDGSDKKKRINN